MTQSKTLTPNQKKAEFIKLVGDEHNNQINSSNNRNSCLLIQFEAMSKKEFEYSKHYKEKDENGNDVVKKITLETINGFKNSDITEFTKSWVDWCFFENPKGKWNSKENKNEWQVVRDSSVCSIAIHKASSEFDKPIIADTKLNKKGKILINNEFINEYLPNLNKDENPNPIYLSFSELKKVCLSWFNDNKASDGSATKLKGLSADIERLTKAITSEMEDDFKKRHDEKTFGKMALLYTAMNTYHSMYKNLFPKNYEILTGKKVEYTPKDKQQKKAS
tara:strand:- start:81 stop:911 length:831 start_codon:yes stop_codon:yes gene_type:complete